MLTGVTKSSEDRYARELRRVRLAQQMLRYGVRQSWVQQWSGCSERRIRSIRHSAQDPIDERKRRGPLPSRASRILSTALLHNEASAIAGLAKRLGMLPAGPVKAARKLIPGLALGERLCWLYEVYREWVPDATLTMERFLLLVLELAEQKTLSLSRCDNCGGYWIIDKLETRHRQCSACTGAGHSPTSRAQATLSLDRTEAPVQRPLFY
jgi:hypothetical protein